YDNLPLVPTPTPLPLSPEFTLTINAYCRLGPNIKYDDYATELAGLSFPIVGRNLEDTWYFVRLMDNMRCWFAKQVGTASGDLSQFHVFFGPPCPPIPRPWNVPHMRIVPVAVPTQPANGPLPQAGRGIARISRKFVQPVVFWKIE
ncbi:MAG: hypothetical protein ABSG01_06820, partial [Anaerolineales bacterium]